MAVAELGDLCLWAAIPVSILAATACLGGALSGRADLSAVGGRAVEAVALLLLISVVGLACALVNVQLEYPFVEAFSGFQESWGWRLAALWSGPAGGVLVLTWLIATAATLSYRLSNTRQAVARTGSLAVLAIIGVLTVLFRAQPFAQSQVPAQFGAGLPLAEKDLFWQAEAVATYLAVASGAFAFSGVVGGQLAETPGRRTAERVAVRLSAGLLTLALLSATWRTYGTGGRMLDPSTLSSVAVFAPSWLLASAYLHAPAGPPAPTWALRWRQILGVAFFPCVLGAGAALLTGWGDVPRATLWVGGLAVGIMSGALTGLAQRRAGSDELLDVPGYGPWAFQGGLLTFGMAAMVAVWSLIKGALFEELAWPLALFAVAAAVAWSVFRPGSRSKRPWVVATVVLVLTVAAVFAAVGRQAPGFAIAAGLLGAMTIGLVTDILRLRAARRYEPDAGPDRSSQPGAVLRERVARRWSSAFAHLAIALIVAGLAAEALTSVDTRPLSPGDTVRVAARLGSEVRVRYLGLSRYQVDEREKRVASFTVYRGDAAPQLVTAATIFDMTTRRESNRPAVIRGGLRDVIVEVTGRTEAPEGILCRASSRPLAVLVWLGGVVLLVAFFPPVRPWR